MSTIMAMKSTTSNEESDDPSSAAAAAAAKKAFFAARQAVNEQQMRYFAAGICGLVALFIISHWTHWVFARGKGLPTLGRPIVLFTRTARSVLVRKVRGFGSAGHALLVATYVAVNCAVAFTNLDISSTSSVACRFGWMATVNMCLLVFLALKNTPMGFLSASSYERLNNLHQVAGYTMFVYMVLHAVLYTYYFGKEGRLESQFAKQNDILGIVAGFAFLLVVFAAAIIRRVWYEAFYCIHVLGWILGVVAVGFHQPDVGKPILAITALAASMWLVDRSIRLARTLYYATNNTVTLHPLPNGGTKIIMKKVPFRAEPGQHCFVWIPSIRTLETHPFTIVSTKPLEFTVRACDGFTGDLHKYAVAHPGASLRASADGPYGSFPDPMSFNKVVVIAGGSGASFTNGLAVNILERMVANTEMSIDFIWAVKKHENLSWFRDHLSTLSTHMHSSKVNISLFVTRSPPSHHDQHHARAFQSVSSQSSGPDAIDLEKSLAFQQQTAVQGRTSNSDDIEKEADQFQEHQGEYRPFDGDRQADDVGDHPLPELRHCTTTGRPDVATLIRDAVSTTPKDKRVLVAACGPAELMRIVRDTTATLIRGDGPGVELHCEQFGW